VASLSDIASLVVATMDLKAVQSVVTAIRVADLSGAATVGKALHDRYEPGRVFHPDDRYERRRVIEPEPEYETRRALLAPQPERLALQPISPEPAGASACSCDGVAAKSKHTIEPPWSKVPWHEPMPPRPVVKVVVRPPDVVNTGRLIDFYM
jgi:hypothetical protein